MGWMHASYTATVVWRVGVRYDRLCLRIYSHGTADVLEKANSFANSRGNRGESMYCSQCWNSVSSSWRHCRICGNNLQESLSTDDERGAPKIPVVVQESNAHPVKLNAHQKKGYLMAALIAGVVLILHNPSQGYYTALCDYAARDRADPDDPTPNNFGGGLYSEADYKRMDRQSACVDRRGMSYENIPIPPSDWVSKSALWKPLSGLMTTMFVLAVIAAVAGFWGRVNRDEVGER